MAQRSYERVSAFREGPMIDAEDDQPRQRSFQTSQSNIYAHYPQFNYKPLILRHVSLLALLLIAAGLIGLLEYAIIELPHSSTQLNATSIKARRQVTYALNQFERRQATSQSSSAESTTTYADTLQSAYVDPSSTATVVYSAASSAYVGTTGSITVSQSSQATSKTLLQHPGAYVGTKKTTSTILATTTQSDYVPTTSATAGAGGLPEPLTDKGKASVVYRTWDAERTFLGTYLAISIAVVYHMLWMTVWNSFNLIDPFLQLMQTHGTTARTAFFSFYQSQSNLFGPIPAMVHKRWFLALVATTYAIVGLLPAFASESVFVDTNWDCPNPDTKHKNNPCHPRISVDVTIVRVLQGLLAFTAATLIGISIYLAFKKTGLPNDPRSMAVIGTLMQHPVLIDDLVEIPVDATRQDMQQSLGDKRYKLGFYKSGFGEQGYGIMPTTDDASSSITPRGFTYAPVEGYGSPAGQARSHPHRLRVMDICLLVVLFGAFGVVLAYYLDGNADGFNNFFNSNTFGPRFILTFSGTVIASMWKSVEQSEVVMAPFNRLARAPSSAQSTIQFRPSSTPISSTWRSLRGGYILVTVITLVTLLAEALNITISGVPYASGQTWQQFIVSTYVSIGILSIMIITTVIVIISRFREPRIPRTPDTLGPIMSYMSGSRMLDDFAGFENASTSARDQSKMYDFKERLRIDGKVAWMVDETSNKYDSYYS